MKNDESVTIRDDDINDDTVAATTTQASAHGAAINVIRIPGLRRRSTAGPQPIREGRLDSRLRALTYGKWLRLEERKLSGMEMLEKSQMIRK
ncbi:hypothetical protein ElyMa_000835600 [Elysia marginata]|uniref:Uncharacterized protein n=1 Tax=Elysia marginata TaxID=1093978 RepID=A0AAV4H2T0_9GAST|nr:hypothetical protein ElyMa_000835600 [Elysia marginata]